MTIAGTPCLIRDVTDDQILCETEPHRPAETSVVQVYRSGLALQVCSR